jgi:N6-adenosine-specific RNA methylase IME4
MTRTREESGEVTTAGLIRIANELRAKQKKRQKGAVAESIDNCTVVPSLDELLAAGSKFACVYADPPWTGGDDNLHFVNALNELHVELLVEDHAHLHMWASDDSLFAAKQAIENWGFEFKGCLLCLNSNGRPGNYWVEAHEYLLLGVRGGLPLMERKLNSWMRSDRDQAGIPSGRVRKLIERVSPGPYLDLFGRQRASGWTIYSTLLESASETTREEEPTNNETEGEGSVEATSA